MELAKEFRFEASHILPKHPGKCSRLHGHSWRLVVYVEGQVNEETGFVMDYADVAFRVRPVIERLDHRHLGTFERTPGDPAWTKWAPIDFDLRIYPSSENLIVWIGEQLETLPWSKLELNETCTSSCTLTRKEYDDRKVGRRSGRGETVLRS